jgi:hypothetical protein
LATGAEGAVPVIRQIESTNCSAVSRLASGPRKTYSSALAASLVVVVCD